ncbi:lethal (1) G0469 NlpC/P60 domain-containing protein isoform X2 [Tachypleus tridentatus]
MANVGYTSMWYTSNYHSRFILELRSGDMIEFQREGYNHWALYAGKEIVFHRASPSKNDLCGLFSQTQNRDTKSHEFGKVMKERLQVVWGDSKARINNSKDSEYLPFNQRKIIQRAVKEMNECSIGQSDFNIVSNNCEHFVTYCRYGTGFSEQVQDVATTVVVAGAGLFVGWLLAKALSTPLDSSRRRFQ